MERHYGWVIVAAGAVITCVAAGSMFALPVYLQPISDDTGWSRAGISMAMTVGFIAMGIGGFFWGTLSDRIGARPVVLIASVMLGVGLFIASRARTCWSSSLPMAAWWGRSRRRLLRAPDARPAGPDKTAAGLTTSSGAARRPYRQNGHSATVPALR